MAATSLRNLWSIHCHQTSSPKDLYGFYNTMFITIRLVHGGKFTPTPGRTYINQKIVFVEGVVISKLSFELLESVTQRLGHVKKPFFYYLEENMGFDLGLISLNNEAEFKRFYDKVFPKKCNIVYTIYVEHGTQNVFAFYPNSLKKADDDLIKEMLRGLVYENRNATAKDALDFFWEAYGVKMGLRKIEVCLDLAKREVIGWYGYDWWD